MDGRISKYKSQVSPERAKVWTERSPKYVQIRKVPVVYYLCRNRQLEHPHFIEVPLSSPDGLYLRDVIEKLNTHRGRGMASMYSWSCKRSYKNGFVWHDLCEDDLIVPAHGNEYVLKGSEVIEEPSPGLSPPSTFRIQNVKQLPEPPSSRSQDDASSSSSMNGKDTKHQQEDEISPPSRYSDSSGVSPESGNGNGSSSWARNSLSLTEYKPCTREGAADASTQTEENSNGMRPSKPTRETCTRGVSTEDGPLDDDLGGNLESHTQLSKQDSQICKSSVSPSPSSASLSWRGKTTETLETLIRADASKINSFRILEEEEVRMRPHNMKMKASNVLMQLISCGSISVKDHNFGLIPTYRPQFSHLKFPSPLYSTSVMLGELDCLSENPRYMGLRLEDKEYFSGSLLETKMLKEGNGHIPLKRSSSYNADRISDKQLESTAEEEEEEEEIPSSSLSSKCLPRSIKASLSKQPKGESMRSPISDKPRRSSGRLDESYIITRDTSNASSKRTTEPSPKNNLSKRLDSFREEEDKIIQIEERLASGARVIIQSKET